MQDSQTRTVQVTNVSDLANEREVYEFFSFSGEIERIAIQRDGRSRTAFVTFKDPKALEIALLLSGATIVDQIVGIIPVANYVPEREMQEVRIVDIATHNTANEEGSTNFGARASSPGNGSVYVSRAQDAVTSMLAKGSALGQDAMSKAKSFDEKHQLTASASAKVVSFDKRVGLTEKLTVGISVVNEKVKSVDQRLQVSDKTMAAIFAAERKLNDTGSAVKTSRNHIAHWILPVQVDLNFRNYRGDFLLLVKKTYPFLKKKYHVPHLQHLNRYVTAGAAWLNGAFGRVAKAGQVAGTKTREKFHLAVSNLTAKDPPIPV